MKPESKFQLNLRNTSACQFVHTLWTAESSSVGQLLTDCYVNVRKINLIFCPALLRYIISHIHQHAIYRGSLKSRICQNLTKTWGLFPCLQGRYPSSRVCINRPWLGCHLLTQSSKCTRTKGGNLRLIWEYELLGHAGGERVKRSHTI